jgi:hypothetical protein
MAPVLAKLDHLIAGRLPVVGKDQLSVVEKGDTFIYVCDLFYLSMSVSDFSMYLRDIYV